MKSKKTSVWKELELGFGGSKSRVILHLVLNHDKALTKYALVKATRLRTPSVESQLETLLRLGWIKEYSFTPATYQANLENEVVRHILEFLRKLKYVKVDR